MPIQPKPNSAPINMSLFSTAMLGSGSYLMWAQTHTAWEWGILSVCFGAGAASSGISGIRLLLKDYKLRKDIHESQRVSSDHGDARIATFEEREQAGMHSLQNMLIGFDGKIPIGLPESIFNMFVMPPGVGKTICAVIPEILHKAMQGYSLYIPDIKMELAPMLAPVLRELGFDVICINPTRGHMDECGCVSINLYQPVLDAVYSETDFRMDASKLAFDKAAMHLPDNEKQSGSEKQFFLAGSRRSISTALLVLAFVDPANCTPTGVYTLLNDSKRFKKVLKDFRDNYEGLHESDTLIEFVKSEANNLLTTAESSDTNDYFNTFLEGATQNLHQFNISGRLKADFGSTSSRCVSEMREKQVIVFMMSPLTHVREFKSFNSQINQDVLSACKYKPDGHPVHMIGEEALAFDYSDLTTDMETLRGLRFTASFYIQSYAGLVRKMGKETAEAIMAYCDCVCFAGINSLQEANMVSDLLSEETIKRQDYSLSTVADSMNISTREMGKRIMNPSQVLKMDKGQAWLFVRGMNPVLFNLAPDGWGSIDPWCDWVGKHPVHKTKLPRKPLFKINYQNINSVGEAND